MSWVRPAEVIGVRSILLSEMSRKESGMMVRSVRREEKWTFEPTLAKESRRREGAKVRT